MTCAEINLRKFFEICAEGLVPKFTRAEVRLPEIFQRFFIRLGQQFSFIGIFIILFMPEIIQPQFRADCAALSDKDEPNENPPELVE